jgi:predicted GNAT family acetyltransferase
MSRQDPSDGREPKRSSDWDAGSEELVLPSADALEELRIVDDAETQRYRAMIGTRTVGAITYSRPASGPMELTSTTLAPALRGLDIESAFIEHVLDELAERGERAVLSCPVIAEFVAQHAEYSTITAA